MTTSNSLLLDVVRLGSNLGLALAKGVGHESISSQGDAGESEKGKLHCVFSFSWMLNAFLRREEGIVGAEVDSFRFPSFDF